MIEKCLIDERTRKLIDASGGLVVVLQDATAVVWLNIPAMFERLRYPHTELSDSMKSHAGSEPYQRAVRFLTSLLAVAQQEFGLLAGLGKVMDDEGTINRLFLSNGTWSVNGTIIAREFQVA